mgnify:CR=1 FL=1
MENLDFVAIDLETATSHRNSICEIGIAIVKNSKIIESKSWLEIGRASCRERV